MTLLLIPAGAAIEEGLRYLLHHRTGATLALLTLATGSRRRIRRLIINPGVRVAGRDTPRPREAAA